MNYIICAEMPRYELGEGVPICYYVGTPGVSLFVLRKHLEKFGLNDIDFLFIKSKNENSHVFYALGVDLEKMKFDTVDEAIADICKRLNIQNDIQILGKEFNKLIEQSSYTF